MPIIRSGWDLDIKIEDVLFAQGADAAVLSRRSPRLIEIADRAIADAYALISPSVVFDEIQVEDIQKEQVILKGGFVLTGSLFKELFNNARSVIVAICTIGDALEGKVSKTAIDDITYSYALDSTGSVAIDQLADLAYHHFEAQKEIQGWKTSIAISPGMIGWNLKEGQNQVFSILASQKHGVKLTDSGLMVPLKSVSMVVGTGPDVQRHGISCDYCESKGRCQFQKHNQLAEISP